MRVTGGSNLGWFEMKERERRRGVGEVSSKPAPLKTTRVRHPTAGTVVRIEVRSEIATADALESNEQQEKSGDKAGQDAAPRERRRQEIRPAIDG